MGKRGTATGRKQIQPSAKDFLKAELTEAAVYGEREHPVPGVVQPRLDSAGWWWGGGTCRALLALAPMSMMPGLYPYRGKWSLLAL